jgi:hypothetical protein
VTVGIQCSAPADERLGADANFVVQNRAVPAGIRYSASAGGRLRSAGNDVVRSWAVNGGKCCSDPADWR